MTSDVAELPNKQNEFIAAGLTAVAQTLTALAIQGITILDINIGVSPMPAITVQYNARLAEALCLRAEDSATSGRTRAVMMAKPVGGCLLRWQQAVVVH